MIPDGNQDEDGQDGKGDDGTDDPEVDAAAEEDGLEDDRRVEVWRLTRRCTVGARTTSSSCKMSRFVINFVLV